MVQNNTEIKQETIEVLKNDIMTLKDTVISPKKEEKTEI